MTLNPIFSKNRPGNLAIATTAIFVVYAASLPFTATQILPGFSLSFVLGIIAAVVGVSFAIHNRSTYYQNASTEKFLIIGAFLSFVLLSLFSGVVHQSSMVAHSSIFEALDISTLTNVCMLWLLLAVHSIQPKLIPKTMLAFLSSSTLIALCLILTWLHFRTQLNDIFLHAKVVEPWNALGFYGHVSQSARFTVFGINENTLAYIFLYGWGVALWFLETNKKFSIRSRFLLSASMLIFGFAIMLTGTRSTLIIIPTMAIILVGASWLNKSAFVNRVTTLKALLLLALGITLGSYSSAVAVARLKVLLNFFIPDSLKQGLDWHASMVRDVAIQSGGFKTEQLNLIENQRNALFGSRGDLWLGYVEQVSNEFLIGIGYLGHKNMSESLFGGSYSTHNLFLDIFIQGGLIGLSLLLFIIAALTYRLVSHVRSTGALAVLALFIILVSHALFVPIVFSKTAFFIFAVIYLVSTTKTFRPSLLKNT